MTTPLSAWERLTAVATLGTERAPIPTDALWPDPTTSHPEGSPPQTLLRAAGATYLWNLAGQRAPVEPASPVRADVLLNDPATHVHERAAWRLARMINGEHKELISEWFALARSHRRTLPPQWLPVALDALTPSGRNEYAAVLGPASQWLASRNEQWPLRAANQQPSEETWNTGTLEERRAELKAQRELDPAVARSWVQSTWADDPPEAREAFVTVLLTGLSLEDESLLESALDDKRKGVRLAAAECLSRLPESAHGQRNRARLEPLLTLEEKKGGFLSGLRKRRLSIELPAALDKPMARDGVEAKPPAQRKIGERAFWLSQMISMAPPTHWTSRFSCDAATFTEAALATDYASELLNALSAAVARHPDREWIDALGAAWLGSGADPQTIAQSLAALVSGAPEAHRAALLEGHLRELVPRRFDVAFPLLQLVDLHWTPAVTKLALDGVAASVRADKQQSSHTRNTFDAWARRCDIAVATTRVPQLLEACAADSPWRNALEQMTDIVEFRAAMNEELRRD
jgi:hypothetical protein